MAFCLDFMSKPFKMDTFLASGLNKNNDQICNAVFRHLNLTVYISLPFVFLAISGLLLIFICSTKRDKMYINDDTGTGGMLLKSNTEAPGEEVVRKPPPFKRFKYSEKPQEDFNYIFLKCLLSLEGRSFDDYSWWRCSGRVNDRRHGQ